MADDDKPAEVRASHDPHGTPPLVDGDRVRRAAPPVNTPPPTNRQKAVAILIVVIVVVAVVIGALR